MVEPEIMWVSYLRRPSQSKMGREKRRHNQGMRGNERTNTLWCSLDPSLQQFSVGPFIINNWTKLQGRATCNATSYVRLKQATSQVVLFFEGVHWWENLVPPAHRYIVGVLAPRPHEDKTLCLSQYVPCGMDNPPLPDPGDEPRQTTPAETAAEAADVPPPSGRAVSEESAELYFLIANFLTNASPCSRAAAVLQQELVRK